VAEGFDSDPGAGPRQDSATQRKAGQPAAPLSPS